MRSTVALLVVLSLGLAAGPASGQAANAPQRTRLMKEPHFQPSFLASGLPSRTRFGVAIHVLRKSAPRLTNNSIRKKK